MLQIEFHTTSHARKSYNLSVQPIPSNTFSKALNCAQLATISAPAKRWQFD